MSGLALLLCDMVAFLRCGLCRSPQFNLFAGTVVALGTEGHLVLLDELQRGGRLGCFGLTEKLAGVNSGLGALMG